MTRQNDSLGERIRRARRAADLSQQGLADALGVARQTVNRWERDEDVQLGVTYGRIREIADALGVSVSLLIPECTDDNDYGTGAAA